MDAPDTVEEEVLAAALAGEGEFTRDYLFLVIASCLLATLGLLENSVAVIIGAMIVAPLMLPIRAMAWGALQTDLGGFRRALGSVVVGVLVAGCLAGLVGALVGLHVMGSEIMARTQPNLLDLGVAVAAGSVSAYAKLKPRIGDAVAGTAIAVALMPPICATGLCAAYGNFHAAAGAFTLFLTNLLGIALSCMGVFALFGHGVHGTRTRRALAATAILTGCIAMPLAVSLGSLLQQARLTAVVRQLLTNRTVTVGQRMELTALTVDWAREEPEVRLSVRAREVPSVNQVALLESFVQQQTGHRFHLVFEVSPIQEVRSR